MLAAGRERVSGAEEGPQGRGCTYRVQGASGRPVLLLTTQCSCQGLLEPPTLHQVSSFIILAVFPPSWEAWWQNPASLKN